MGLDPGTNRAGLHTAREVISGRQISYPVPYILVILCVLCLACLNVAAHSADATQTIALVLACSAFARRLPQQSQFCYLQWYSGQNCLGLSGTSRRCG